MRNLLFITLTLAFVSVTHAQTEVKSYFDKIEATSKGPFGQNMMQMSSRRISYNQWASSGGNFIFQSAFRNDTAKALIKDHGIYTGNLFSTNYYELRAESILGNPDADNLNSNHGLQTLVDVAKINPLVFERARQMVQNWNLEKLYILKNPSSRLARSFALRGISGAEFEIKYAQEFVDFYIETAPAEIDMLLLTKLMNSSSLVESNNFTRIRDKATVLYENYRSGGPKGHTVTSQQVSQIKFIRDSIHNQLTPEVLTFIDAYLKQKNNPELVEIKGLILTYFARGVADINHVAKKGDIQPVGLDKINVKSPVLSDLTAYANELTAVRNSLKTDQVKLGEKYLGFAYMLTASSFLFEKTRAYIDQNRINESNIGELTVLIQTLLNLEGLIKTSDISNPGAVPTDFDNYEVFYDDLLSVIMTNIKDSYSPYVEKWQQIDDRMSGILDDTLRSSSMGLFDHILDKMD